uniref:Uncharacterized protein n=1 Tax=viral metagenome TaxID=1070528 RepID=A0A6H1ZCZ4_9ZZZZ
MKSFSIHFSDLTKDAQEELCEEFQTTPQEENWDIIPLATIDREEEGEDQCQE